MNQLPLQPQLPGDYFGSVTEPEPIDLRVYWRVVRKHLFGIIGLAIAVGILAMLYANSLSPVYTATTKVSIEHVSPRTVGIDSMSWYSMSNYAGTQYELIKSRSVAEKVVENLRLWENPYFDKPRKPVPFSIGGLRAMFTGDKENSQPVELSSEEKEKLRKE